MKEFVIIVAGGSGSRMQSTTPKQFLLLAKKPILMHTIDAFRKYSNTISIILVLPKYAINIWNELCAKYSFSNTLTIVEGGDTRYNSVKNGLKSIINEDSLVAIHDGVRPLVDVDIIGNSFRLAQIHGSAIAAMPLKESLVSIDNDRVQSIDRTKYRSIQTPQTFQTRLIKAAYKAIKEDLTITDDATVAQKYGLEIVLFNGSYANIKVTTPEDMLVAEALLDKNK